jgi:tRNA threonylcarbamoyladenosine biosynthesis protein TsaB
LNFLLINSNNESSFVAAVLGSTILVKYTYEYLVKTEKSAYLKSPDKLAHCLKFITDEIISSGTQLSGLDAISVISGPGSFTGIRVGLALAKGYADSLGKKIIPLDNFELLFKRIQNKSGSGNYCLLIPAKEPEFYFSFYQNNAEIERGCIKSDEILSKFDKNTILVGNFSDDYKEKLGYFSSLDKKYMINELNSMVSLTEKKYLAGQMYNSSDIEPLYMKDFTFRTVNSSKSIGN